jgi:hypothetical protein
MTTIIDNTTTVVEPTPTTDCHRCGTTTENTAEHTYVRRHGNLSTGVLCDNCLMAMFTCDDCGRLSVEDRGDGNITLCARCRDNNYRMCDSCDRLVHDDDMRFNDDVCLCPDCHEEDSERRDVVIHPYEYKPEPVFHGDGLHFGIELEVENSSASDNSRVDTAENITSTLEGLVYCKYDGSVRQGFEIVTHPVIYSHLKYNVKMESVLDTLRKEGYKSHDTSTCGLHIHVERACLTEEQITRIVSFFNSCITEIEKVGRREYNNYCRAHSVRRYGALTVKKCLDKRDHYDAVSLRPNQTIEIRVFKGTLNYKTLMATVLFVKSVIEWTKVCTFSDTKKWSNYAKWVTSKRADFDDRQDLLYYLRSRGVKDV